MYLLLTDEVTEIGLIFQQLFHALENWDEKIWNQLHFKLSFFKPFWFSSATVLIAYNSQYVSQFKNFFRLLVSRWREVYSFWGIWGPYFLNFTRLQAKLKFSCLFTDCSGRNWVYGAFCSAQMAHKPVQQNRQQLLLAKSSLS